MRTKNRSILAAVAATGLSTVILASLALPAQAIPERFADSGTILECEGEGGSLSAMDTLQMPASWNVAFFASGLEAFAFGDTALLVGDHLSGTFPAYDPDTGTEFGDVSLDGHIERGTPEVLADWDEHENGRLRTEGTRTALSGAVTLSLRGVQTTLSCTGWDFDTETFQLNAGQPVADRYEGWFSDGYELEGGAGSIGFYGERETELGIALDLVEPAAFAGERLQIRNGAVDGTLLLRDPETWQVTGLATVSGTVSRTGSDQVVEEYPGYQRVEDYDHYAVSLSVSTSTGEWSGTWETTHYVKRIVDVVPPSAL
jgi:hypothetical protein